VPRLPACHCQLVSARLSSYAQHDCCELQVYDVRMTPRLLTLLPFTAGPAMLRFHPAFSGTLLLASASGIFSLADAQGSSQYAQTYQVGTGSQAASDGSAHVAITAR
jgi:hypothetical protein